MSWMLFLRYADGWELKSRTVLQSGLRQSRTPSRKGRRARHPLTPSTLPGHITKTCSLINSIFPIIPDSGICRQPTAVILPKVHPFHPRFCLLLSLANSGHSSPAVLAFSGSGPHHPKQEDQNPDLNLGLQCSPGVRVLF